MQKTADSWLPIPNVLLQILTKASVIYSFQGLESTFMSSQLRSFSCRSLLLLVGVVQPRPLFHLFLPFLEQCFIDITSVGFELG